MLTFHVEYIFFFAIFLHIPHEFNKDTFKIYVLNAFGKSPPFFILGAQNLGWGDNTYLAITQVEYLTKE